MAIDPHAKIGVFAVPEGFQLRKIDKKLTLLSKNLITPPSSTHTTRSCGAWCNNRFVVTYSAYDHSGILIIDPTTFSVEKQIDFANCGSISLDASTETSMLVCGLNGPKVALIDIFNGKQREFHPFRGISDNYWIEARISANGAVIASYVSPQLAITDQNSAKSYTLLSVEQADSSECLSFFPDFCFFGKNLYQLSEKSLRQLELADSNQVESAFISEHQHPEYQHPHRYSSQLSFGENLVKSGLAQYVTQLEAMWLPAIRIDTTTQETCLLGASHFGGLPDLPEAIAWPYFDETPMTLIGQINLDELSSQFQHPPLPKQGMLFFFFADTEEGWDYLVDPEMTEGLKKMPWKVIYWPDIQTLLSTEKRVPVADHMERPVYPLVSLEFVQQGANMPEIDSQLIENLELTDIDTEHYIQLIKQLSDSQTGHQLLGYPGIIQNNTLELDAELITRGESLDQIIDRESPEYDEIMQAASDWVLLMQCWSDGKIDWMWGDAGLVYWMIRRQDLAALQFNRVVLLFVN